MAVVFGFVLRGPGGGRAGSGAAQGDLFTKVEDPGDTCEPGYGLAVKKPRVLEMSGRERVWLAETTVVGMLGAMIAQRVIRALYRAIRKRAPESVFDPNSARFSWPDVVLWAAAAGIGLGVAKVTSARVARFGWEVATGTLPPGIVEERAEA